MKRTAAATLGRAAFWIIAFVIGFGCAWALLDFMPTIPNAIGRHGLKGVIHVVAFCFFPGLGLFAAIRTILWLVKTARPEERAEKN